jgi:hypothetical protein
VGEAVLLNMKTELGISVQVETSINDYVYVRLTEEGRKYLKSYFNDKNWPPDIKKDMFESHTRVDKEGWTRFELSDLMHLFGPIMYLGNPVAPFVDNVVRIGEREGTHVEVTST